MSNWIGVNIHERPSCGIVDGLKSQKALVRRVKAEDRFLCDADMVVGHDAKHHRAGRRTRAIDHNVVTGVADGHEARPIDTDIAAGIIGDPQNG